MSWVFINIGDGELIGDYTTATEAEQAATQWRTKQAPEHNETQVAYAYLCDDRDTVRYVAPVSAIVNCVVCDGEACHVTDFQPPRDETALDRADARHNMSETRDETALDRADARHNMSETR